LRLVPRLQDFKGAKLGTTGFFEPAKIDAVVLSHAHLDHSGWLPVLLKQGFKGAIYASKATRDLVEVLLLDSAHLQEEDARRANRGGWSRHHPALPLYNLAEAKRAIDRVVVVQSGRGIRVGPVKIDMVPAGHLLGAMAVSCACGRPYTGFFWRPRPQ
jgi:metallo-beta-lactamase family protein